MTIDVKPRAFTSVIVRPQEMRTLLRAAANGDPTTAAVVKAIGNWLAQAHTANPEKAPLCLDCDTSFTDDALPHAFAVLMPFIPGSGPRFFHKTGKSGNAITTGFCARCAERCPDELQDAAIRGWSKIMPSLQVVKPGRS